MYLGGQRVVFWGEQDGSPITYSYFDQPDWPVPVRPNTDARFELVYLDVTELEVGAVEDPDLLEVALGGPDTTQRLKLLRRVRRTMVSDPNCAGAWATQVNRWQQEGFAFDPTTMRLLPQLRLQVGFTQDLTTTDPCDPVATGGYLGTDNQLIRVRTAGPDHLIWGYDNASFLYRITSVTPDGTMLTLAADPPDGFHVPQTGQLVEVLQTAAVLADEPDVTNPGGQILRVAADATGILRSLARPYGPVTQGDPTNYIVLDSALPAQVAGSNLPLFLRVWQSRLSLPQTGGTVTIADPSTASASPPGISTGITVTISPKTKSKIPDGAFWQIAVRPATPQGVYPEELLVKPQPPDGPRRWVCPLAVIDWSADGAPPADCRNIFDNLVELTRRKPGCCTVAIEPADISASVSLQALIDAAADKATTVTVCLAPGAYPLPRPLRLYERHGNVTLDACGYPVTLHPDASADPALFADGLIVLTGAFHATLRGLTLRPAIAQVERRLLDALLERAKLADLPNPAAAIGRPYTAFCVRAHACARLTLDNCTFDLYPSQHANADLFAAGLFVQGLCPGLTVQNCAFYSGIEPTFTPITVDSQLASPVAAANLERVLERFNPGLLTPASPPSSPPTSPSASPPPTPQMPLSERMDTAFAAVIAHRQTLGAAGFSPIVATVGIVAADYAGSDNQGGEPCDLGDATLRDNQFTTLSFATWISAAASTLRVKDNIILDGIAGLWLQASGAVVPHKPEPNTQYYPGVQQFEEFMLASALAAAVPRPADPGLFRDARVTKRDAAGKLALLPTEFTLFVLGNKIETRSAVGTKQFQWGSSSAVLLALNTGIGEGGLGAPYLSVIISANHLRTQTGQYAPAALIVLPASQACTITGNVVLNFIYARDREGSPSLWVVSELGEIGPKRLTVAGNSLSGLSDLIGLPRPGSPVAGGWHSYNADPW
jgi:hypothetical protein